MSSYKERIANLDLYQLKDFQNAIQHAIAEKQAEERRTVWRVFCGHFTVGNFRSDEYLKAVECLATAAKKAHSIDCNDREELQFSIEAERVPVSEYEGWF
ncbi:hypothetical protein [Limnobaculum xujianqingii]|uniref:hypothetical protein n=1 Tax=Limnobaculum xujianqingii TaxID=2738837 RepID=UPI0011289ADE|nr:hypothetical protein [Limnobaculum xujianqingii]